MHPTIVESPSHGQKSPEKKKREEKKGLPSKVSGKENCNNGPLGLMRRNHSSFCSPAFRFMIVVVKAVP